MDSRDVIRNTAEKYSIQSVGIFGSRSIKFIN